MSIDNEVLKAAVVTAMFDSIDAKAREELIRNALASLLAPSLGVAGTEPLQLAWNRSLRQVADEIVLNEVRADSALREKIVATAVAAMRKAFEDPRIVDAISGRLVQAVVDAVNASWR